MVTQKMMLDALRALGVKEGDSILTHSSFKSLGGCENGADTVISAMKEAVGEEGTVIFPTLCQKDWEHVYENWHMDAPSDVGYLTNYFRSLPDVLRSNQATHSVAAWGKDAEYLTKTHGESGLRFGMFGDTPFSKDSPWQKMYEMNTKTIFLGCRIKSCTFRHLAEYMLIDEYLEKAKNSPDYEELKDLVWHYSRWERAGIWPHIKSVYLEEVLRKEGKVTETTCGDATIFLINSRDFVDLAMTIMHEHNRDGLNSFSAYTLDHTLDWFTRVENL